MAKDLFLLNDLFDFDRKFYTFVRPEKDMMPYTIINKENQTILIHNVVGINKEDLKISIKTENGEKILYIVGQTKDKISGNNYEINSRFKIKGDSAKEYPRLPEVNEEDLYNIPQDLLKNMIKWRYE